MNNKNFDLSLYLVTDRFLAKDKDLLWIIEEAVQGGVSIVQLREKELSFKKFSALAKKVKVLLDSLDIPLIINDRVEVAMEVDASGVHLGQSDMSYQAARNILGKDKIIGISVENLWQAILAEKDNADYIAYSPVFFTNTKNDIIQPMGLIEMNKISRFTKLPSVGIGGINIDNAEKVIRLGADGIAVISAIISDDNPQKAAYNLRQIVDKAKQNALK